MNLLKEFFDAYGVAILYALITAIGGYLGIQIKKVIEKWLNTKEKREIARICVRAVEQMYKDLHGEEKFEACCDAAEEMLMQAGINVTSLELRMLIEAAVNEFNEKSGIGKLGNDSESVNQNAFIADESISEMASA